MSVREVTVNHELNKKIHAVWETQKAYVQFAIAWTEACEKVRKGMGLKR